MPRKLKTRVFEIRSQFGYDTDYAMADAMGVSQSLVSAVRNKARGPGNDFIAGALKAFPGMTFEQLFFYADVAEPVEAMAGA